jgi:hypothetical protein
MKKLILLLLFIPLVFSCVNTNEIIEKDKIEISSTEKNLKPIYVLDGIQINNIDTISPSSISEIFVLKGQKAKEKYGAIGENGVIEIILKKTKP